MANAAYYIIYNSVNLLVFRVMNRKYLPDLGSESNPAGLLEFESHDAVIRLRITIIDIDDRD